MVLAGKNSVRTGNSRPGLGEWLTVQNSHPELGVQLERSGLEVLEDSVKNLVSFALRKEPQACCCAQLDSRLCLFGARLSQEPQHAKHKKSASAIQQSDLQVVRNCVQSFLHQGAQ